MCGQQEMTLDEWVGKLPSIHRASKELTALREDLKAVAAETFMAATSQEAEVAFDHLNKALARPGVQAVLKEKG